MFRVKDIMTTNVLTLSPEMTLREAVEQLASVRVSGAPVIAGDHVVGTLSANDILSFLVSTPGVPALRQTADLIDGGEQVEDGDAPSGAYFTDLWEDAGAATSERFSATDQPEWDFLAEHIVSEAMSTNVSLLPPETPLIDVAAHMQKYGVHRALVGTNGHLLGIVTTMDITRIVGYRLLGR